MKNENGEVILTLELVKTDPSKWHVPFQVYLQGEAYPIGGGGTILEAVEAAAKNLRAEVERDIQQAIEEKVRAWAKNSSE